MLIKVNKKISSRNAVQYAALSTGTISHVWYDEASDSASSAKRKNHIRMTRDTSSQTIVQQYDA
jgi:hypothetical protein